MPTLLALADTDIPSSVEGTDLSGICRGETCEAEPSAAFCQGMGPSVDWDDGFEWRAIRDKQHTYAVFRKDGSEFLFDNVSDPLQMQNLVDVPEFAHARERLAGCMRQKMDELGDTFETITWYRVEAENFESIHNHNAYAVIEKRI